MAGHVAGGQAGGEKGGAVVAAVLRRGQQAELARLPLAQASAGQVRVGADGRLALGEGGGHALPGQQGGVEGAGKGGRGQV